jgi:hypothetical protein
MTFIVLIILRISTSLLFEMKGYKVEYYALIDAYDENRNKDRNIEIKLNYYI